MSQPTGRWARVQSWIGEHRDLEGWLRLISPAVLYSALDERLTFREALQKALRKPVPNFAFRRTLCLGGTATLLFVNQIVTGVLLAIYYTPSPGAAYTSVGVIEQQIPMGWLIRQMHAWGGQLMILFVLLHMTKVFFNKAYRHPRELTWVTGTLLFFITLSFGFTGYLLPWDQRAYWASTVGTALAEGVPVIGHWLLLILRGGEEVTGLTISRFFAVHAVVLPWITGALMVAHYIIIRRLGISKPL
jgi:quinol-cytochrome oxidoreductase complex cytochrome b subunit